MNSSKDCEVFGLIKRLFRSLLQITLNYLQIALKQIVILGRPSSVTSVMFTRLRKCCPLCIAAIYATV